MKRNKYLLAVLLCMLLTASTLITGCKEKQQADSKPAGSGTEAGYESYTEDDSYQSAVIHESWDNYEVTTNEIGYDPNNAYLEEDGYYTSEEDVATYIIEYGTLPDNFITKKEARSLGWSGGGLDDYAEDCSIGGDYFRNNEGLLPDVEGRTYYECDIDTMNAKKRGAKRIIYSNDGQIYYTDDHYESFTLIYGTD